MLTSSCLIVQVGATALGMNSPLLLRHTFDVVIVDEAGQMTLPATIAPLLKARAFVLVRSRHRYDGALRRRRHGAAAFHAAR